MLADQTPVDHKKLDKISLWIIIVVSFFIFIGGAMQIRASLFSYDRTVLRQFRDQLAEYQIKQNDQIVAGSSDEAQEIALLQSRDTDGDTLNDFEETYAYGTSAYLTDSDSDGIADNEELTQDTNPSCPEGQECEQERVGGDGTSTDAEKAFSTFKPSDLIKVASGEDGEPDPEEIRKQLIAAGVPEDVVKSTDDETLLKLFNDTVGESGASYNPVVDIKKEAEALKNLSIEEKRNLLVKAGVDTAQVNALTEDQLNQLFDEAIAKALEDQGIPADDTTAPVDEEPIETESQEENNNE